MFDQHGHRSNARNASLPLAVREKLRPGRLQLALAALAQPHLTQRLQEEQHVLFYRWTLGGVALAGRLGATWKALHAAFTAGGRFSRALFVSFHLRSRRITCFLVFWFTSAIGQVQLPLRARDRRTKLRYGNLAGAGIARSGREMI